MSKKAKTQKTPTIDPQKLIAQSAAMNRVNVSNPFGSQNYSTGPDGQSTLTTTLSPEMQALLSKQVSRASTDRPDYALPPGFNDLLASAMQKVQSRMGS